jgi:hypothetical protein
MALALVTAAADGLAQVEQMGAALQQRHQQCSHRACGLNVCLAAAAAADGLAHTEHMGAALKQQPALRSLELVMRASAGHFGSVLTPDVPGFILKPLRQVRPEL